MNGFITASELLSEISSRKIFLDSPHLIDKASAYRWMFLALRQFGLNIMQKKSTVVEVKNYRAYLPDDFGQLSLAAFCQKDNCVVRGDVKELVSSRIYTTKIETTEYFNSMKVCDNGGDCTPDCKIEKTIQETIEISPSCSVDFYYSRPIYVRIGRDVLDGACTSDCINRYVKNSPYSINIKNKEIHAGFKEGSLYIEYYALPQDEEGLPLIPRSPNSYLERYVESFVTKNIISDAMWSGDITNKLGIYGELKADTDELLHQARADVSKLSMISLWNYISAVRQNNFKINLGRECFRG